jgi:4'-phosphopantetheinyl transferase
MAAPVMLRWPDRDRAPAPGADGTPVVLMLATPATTLRDAARALVRTALRSYLAPLVDCIPAMVPLQIEPGQAPRLDVPGRSIHLSISHEAGLTLAAVRDGARVGVDLMRAADAALPDWQATAQDYLGTDATARILAVAAAERPRAFARAWTRHEAALKCLGLPLSEWTPALARTLASCELIDLPLPAGYVGAVALHRHAG